jgi:putative two-component system response regulator
MLISDEAIHGSTILAVDDDPHSLAVIAALLEDEGFQNVVTTTAPEQVLELFSRHRPDLVILDLHMPGQNGLEVMRDLDPWISASGFLPIVVLTGDATPESRQQALKDGAMDFLTKPFDATEVSLRIRNLLATRHMHSRIEDQNQFLEHLVSERTAELEEARLEILDRLARAAEFRDDETGQHTRRVGELAEAIGRVLGFDDRHAELLRRAAPLHDLGKIGIPDAVLLKPGKLSRKEHGVMRGHTLIGAQILSGSEVPLLHTSSAIALTHHERWDGNGYPEGMRGTDIPLVGRIVAVADVFDALTHARPYKQAWSIEQAMDELRSQAGEQFDPAVVEAFLYHMKQNVV